MSYRSHPLGVRHRPLLIFPPAILPRRIHEGMNLGDTIVPLTHINGALLNYGRIGQIHLKPQHAATARIQMRPIRVRPGTRLAETMETGMAPRHTRHNIRVGDRADTYYVPP